jgi:hypothetical protein
MKIFSIEFWVVLQIMMDLVLILLLVFFFKHLQARMRAGAVGKAVEQVIGMLEPLLKEADSTARAFEVQLKEKHCLIDRLNESLDSRIISLNLLLNRSEAYLSGGSCGPAPAQGHVYDQQAAILELHKKGEDTEGIARKLAMPKCEVDLVIDLKKKFLELE